MCSLLKEHPIEINKKDTANLLIFEQPNPKQYIVKSYCEEFGKAVFKFHNPTTNLDFKFQNNKENDSIKTFFEYSIAKDTVTYWFTNYQEDSLKVIVSDNGKTLDTLSIHIKPKEQKKRGDKSYKFMLIINSVPASGQFISPENDFFSSSPKVLRGLLSSPSSRFL